MKGSVLTAAGEKILKTRNEGIVVRARCFYVRMHGNQSAMTFSLNYVVCNQVMSLVGLHTCLEVL